MKKSSQYQQPQPQIFVDSPETTEIKQSITKKYLENILPYELMIETLEKQNEEIYALQNKYKLLKQENSKGRQNDDLASLETSTTTTTTTNNKKKREEFLEIRKKKRIMERKMFVEEGLKANAKKYDLEFTREHKDKREEMNMKKIQVSMPKENKLNIFVNFAEGFIDELLVYANNEQKNYERKNEKLSKEEQLENDINNDDEEETSTPTTTTTSNNKDDMKLILKNLKNIYEKKMASNDY